MTNAELPRLGQTNRVGDLTLLTTRLKMYTAQGQRPRRSKSSQEPAQGPSRNMGKT
jgi:hypothetical protein